MKTCYLKSADFIREMYIVNDLQEIIDEWPSCPECDATFSRGPYEYEPFSYNGDEKDEDGNFLKFTTTFNRYIKIYLTPEETSSATDESIYDESELVVPIEATSIFIV